MKNNTFVAFFLTSILLVYISISISGYRYGVGDQIIHIPYITKLIHPSLFKNDNILEYLTIKPSFFWETTYPVFKIIGNENGTFALHLVSLFLFFLGAGYLTFHLTQKKLATFISLWFLTFQKYSFGYSSLFVFDNLIPRNLTIGPILISIALFLKQRKTLAYFIIALLSLLHILSTLPVFLSFAFFDFSLLLKKTIYKEKQSNLIHEFLSFLKNLAVFIFGISPLLYKTFIFQSYNSRNVVNPNMFVNYYTSVLKPFYEANTTSNNLMFLNAILLIVFSAVLVNRYINKDNFTKYYLIFLSSFCYTLVYISVLAETAVKNSFLIQLQLGRSGVLSIIIFVVCISLLFDSLIRKYNRNIVVAVSVICSGFFTLISPLFLFFILDINKLKGKIFITTLSVGLLLISIYFNYKALNYVFPSSHSIDIYPQKTQNYLAQDWIKNNTSEDSIVLAPYYIGGYTEPDFRTFSERTNVLTNGDIVETILNVNLYPITKDKVNDLSLNNFEFIVQNRKFFDYYALRDLYHVSVIKNKESLIKKYNISYVVFEADYDLRSDIPVYTNEKFKIYKVS